LFLAAGLVALTACGLYARRRLTQALAHRGVGARPIRIVRWTLTWLLFGYPALMVLVVAGSLLLGRATVPWLDGPLASWLLVLPFAWTLLVVIQAAPWLLALDLAHVIVRRRRGTSAAARVRALGVFAILGTFAIYTPARILVEHGTLRMRHYELSPGRAPGHSGVPAFRIAFLADVQQDRHTDGARARQIYASIDAQHPDLVLSGGDWINTGPDYIEDAAAAAGTLRSRLGTFSVRGDHEHFAYADRGRSVREVEDAMRRHGVTMVNDDIRWFEHHGKRIGVVLLGHNYLVRADGATVDALVARVATADYAIVVTHQLDGALAARLADRVDLVLAGHTHGGQVNPVLGLCHVPLARLETPYVDGRYQLGTTTIIVTAGIGTSIVPIRYAAPGSVEMIDLAL